MKTQLLERLEPDDISGARREPFDIETILEVADIVEDVREKGEQAIYEHGVRLGDLQQGEPILIEREDLEKALDTLPDDRRALLERTAERIESFARAQLEAIGDVETPIPGGRAGHTVGPVERAGCYAPGLRCPYPSPMLMTTCTARVAGVGSIWAASPKPDPMTMAAAAIGGADALLTVGGAQAIAAMAYGAGDIPACDVIAGPGSRWVTCAKKIVSGRVRIDILGGPAEIVVLADASADPATIAADLIAQAEHASDALPVLVTVDEALADAVDLELAHQLEKLPRRAIAASAIDNGFAVVAPDLDSAIEVSDRIAPNYVELHLDEPDEAAQRLRNYGLLCIGSASGGALGDFGAGPNHALPTGGAARSFDGLSVFTFLRTRTWMRIEDVEEASQLVDDAVELGRIEGLEGHARSAERRKVASTADEG